MQSSSLRACATCALLAGCAASQPHAAAPRREIVVEDSEAGVVRVDRAPARRPGEPADLPVLPQALESTSPAFQRGFALALELLHAPGPASPAAQSASTAETWLASEFEPWFARRQRAIVQLAETFAAMAPAGAEEPASEHVVAVALVGLVTGRMYDQLVSVPPPPDLQRDDRLARIYRSELQRVLDGVVGQSIVAHRRCAERAAQQRELAFGPWLELCHVELEKREGQRAEALALQQAVDAEREAARREAEGPRPPGPEICWIAAPAGTPAASQDTTAATLTPAAAEAGKPEPLPVPQPAASPATPAACALDAAAADPRAAQPLSPRDLRYGARDSESGVRVSASLSDNPTMDARPLAWLATQSRLAGCFARHVREERPITVAVHANLTVDPRGRTQSVTLAPEPSDAATAPAQALDRCLRQVLKQTAFTCSPSGQPTQARASFCLRRD